MPAWVAWVWAVSVGLIRPFGEPSPSKLGVLTLGATVWLASPWGRSVTWFALRPGGQVLGSALAAGAARAGPAYAAAFAESFPSVTAGARVAWRSRVAAAVFNPVTAAVVLGVGATVADVNLQTKHGAGVWGADFAFGVAPSKHLEGGKPWWS